MMVKIIIGKKKEMQMEKTKDKVIFDGDTNLKCCGHYKKDKPHKDIGLQKWRYRKRFIVDADFLVVAKNKERADELFNSVAKNTTHN